MTLKLKDPKPRTETHTHEPTDVKVTFKRLGHTERTRLLGKYSVGGGRIEYGGVVAEACEPGVCVHHWEGVEGPDGQPVPYSLAALDWVTENVTDFGAWFNDHILIMCRLVSEEEDTPEGNSQAPDNGRSTDQNPETEVPS